MIFSERVPDLHIKTHHYPHLFPFFFFYFLNYSLTKHWKTMVINNSNIHRPSSIPSVVKQWLLLMPFTHSPTNSNSDDCQRRHHHTNSLFESTYFSFPDYEALQQPELEKPLKECASQEHLWQSILDPYCLPICIYSLYYILSVFVYHTHVFIMFTLSLPVVYYVLLSYIHYIYYMFIFFFFFLRLVVFYITDSKSK